MKILISFILGFCLLLPSQAQKSQQLSDSKLFKEFVKAQKKGEASMLLDYSFAGYHHAEVEAPTVNYKVFNVLDYGAIPNDIFSDRMAIEKAIAAAEANGSGIIYFPKGRFLVCENEDPKEPIYIHSSNIVFRGEGAGVDGTELFMNKPLRAPNETEKWTSPNMFCFSGRHYSPQVAVITEDAEKGSFEIEVDNTKNLKKGDWICLRLSNNSSEVISKELHPYKIEEDWTNLLYIGVQVYDFHQIVSVKNNRVILKEPLMREIEKEEKWYVQQFPHIEEVGVEDIAFVGNFLEKFVHHKDDIHDGGWKMLEYKNVVNSWIRRCRFTNVSEMASIRYSANVSVYDCSITGNTGHNAVHADCSSRTFLGAIDDQPAQWHSVGVCKPAIGTVIWRVRTNANSCFESHASQPRATLFDACHGGFMRGRCGGAIMNNPNHFSDLVFWNYEELDQPSDNFDFWPTDTRYFRFTPPIFVGFHGTGTSFNASQVAYEESHGTPVAEESLFEAQLKLRLGKLPNWVSKLKDKVSKNDFSGSIPTRRETTVGNTSDLMNAINQASLGEVILLNDGNYSDVKINVKQSGSFAQPLEIKAKNPGKVTFTGDVKVELRGNHILFSGIKFTDGARDIKKWKSHGPGLVAIYGDYCEVSECLFYNFDDANSAYITTSLDETGRVPQFAHIHHCAFIEKATLDQVINLNNTPTADKTPGAKPGIPMYHRIDHCYFSNPKKKGNAGGGIRVGYWRKDYGRCLIDHNLFERQDSEAEIITSKSMENVYYNNTFLNCQGTMNFRHGDKQVAINNFFIGTDTKHEYGGMFVWGSNHIIASNFFLLPTTLKSRGNSALYLNCGPKASEHALAYDNSIINNTFINTNGTDINFASLYDNRVKSFGQQAVEIPYDNRFIGNRFYCENPRTQPIVYDPLHVVQKQKWVENIYNGVNTGVKQSIEGLTQYKSACLRYDDSKVYVEDAPLVSDSILLENLPYQNIKGIELNFFDLIKTATVLSPTNRSAVGPTWCKKMPTEYADTGIFKKNIQNKK